MTGKTHRILGISSGATFALASLPGAYSPATLASVVVGSYFASLIPDLDRSTSDFWENIPLGRTVGKIVDPLLKHRNISHSLVGIILFSIIIFFVFKSFPEYWSIDKNIAIFSLIVAYCSHILADMFTVDGVPLFYPLKKPIGLPPKPFHGIRILAGKWFENLVIFPVLNIYFIAIIVAHWQKIKQIIYK